MKIVPILFALGTAAAILSSCSANSYSKDLKAEKKLIEDYIAREHINVIKELPKNDEDWGEKDYYQVSGYDYLYYHLVKRGPKVNPITATETAVMRFKQYTLTVNADTADYWTTLNSAYPLEFTYLTDYTKAPTAWHVAVGLMEYSDSECKIICPSKLGFTDDQTTVTPYGYHMKMKIKR